MPRIVAALQAVVDAVQAAAADLNSTSIAAADVPPGTPLTSGAPAAPAGGLPPPKWGSLLSQAVAELGAVLSLLPLAAEWKEQISGTFAALLRQLLAARRGEQQPMLAGFRSTVASGRRRLPLTGADAAQVGPVCWLAIVNRNGEYMGILQCSGRRQARLQSATCLCCTTSG